MQSGMNPKIWRSKVKEDTDIRTKDFVNQATAVERLGKEFREWLHDEAASFEELMMLYQVAAKGDKGDLIGRAARRAARYVYQQAMRLREPGRPGSLYYEPYCKIKAEDAAVWISHTPYVPIEVTEKNAGDFYYDLHVISLGRDGIHTRFENSNYQHKLEGGSWLDYRDMIPVQYKTNLPGIFKLLHCHEDIDADFGNEFLLLTEKRISMKKFREFLFEKGLYPGSILSLHHILDYALKDIPNGILKAEMVFREHDMVLCDHGAAGEEDVIVAYSMLSKEIEWSKKAYNKSIEPGQLVFLTDKGPS